MANITLQVDRDEDLKLLLELIRRLNLAVVKVSPMQTKTPADERQRMIDYILKYQNDKPSFGDAAEWQSRERT